MNFPDSKVEKLCAFLTTFADEQMAWEAPLAGEKEPTYTARVLAPQVESFLATLNEPRLQLKADGDLRPVPIAFDSRHFYPDISIDHLNERVLAIECKFMGDSHVNSSLTTAIGQAVVYRSLGYRAAFVFLISRLGPRCVPTGVSSQLNETLFQSQIFVSELCRT